MKRVLAGLALCLATPLAAVEGDAVQSVLDYTIERDGIVLLTGSAYPTTGAIYEETVTEAYPPVCPKGDVETGHRRTYLYFDHYNYPGVQFRVYLAISEYREIEDEDRDRCVGKREEPKKFSHGSSFQLAAGEQVDIDAGEGIVIRVHRR